MLMVFSQACSGNRDGPVQWAEIGDTGSGSASDSARRRAEFRATKLRHRPRPIAGRSAVSTE
jgi:hypothetical protein